MRVLLPFLICCAWCWACRGEEIITILNQDTSNPTLLYRDKPMLKTGPICEDRVFMYALGSDYFDHRAWFDYMSSYEFGFGRVYPAHTWHEDQHDKSRRPLYPFRVHHYTKEGPPVVDLLAPDEDYWANFSRVLDEAEQREIVICIQLYQRWYWGNATARKRLFFDKNYNINGIHETNPQTVWKHMSVAYPQGKLWLVHRNFVKAVLDAVGDHKNVVIDLMNEGSIKEGMTKAWVNHTLEIIETWERQTGRDILVGMDIDHFLQKKEPAALHWLLSHPGMELIIGEDKWIYFDGDELLAMRRDYKKPILWLNEKARDYMDTYSLGDSPNRRLHYLWLGMMTKIQGLGLYEKGNHTQEGLLTLPQARELGTYNRTLMRFFRRDIKDYARLRCRSTVIETAPDVPCKLALSSGREAIVYLHQGFGRRLQAGATLKLAGLSLREGPVSVRFVHPNTGKSSARRLEVENGRLQLTLPAFHENLAVSIQPD